MLGRPEETAAHEYALAQPKTRHSPRWAPASAAATDGRGPCVSETDRGTERTAA